MDKQIVKLKEEEYSKLSNFFSVFSDSTRLRIIIFLLDYGGACCVTKISDALSLNQPAVSQQMRVLRSAGLVSAKRDGKFIRYEITDKHVREVISIGISHIKSFPSEEV